MSTANLNPELKAQVDDLQMDIMTAAIRNRLPPRFTCKAVIDKPCVIITDTDTDKTTEVPLFALGAVRKILNDLFN